jgi:hypothetical protein
LAEHAQPVPVIETSVKPDGIVSVTVTVPVVDPAPAWFETVTVYVPLCPCVKLPVCVELMPSTGSRMVAVESVPVALPDPPPDTVTEFTCGDAAFAATFTVTASDG